MHAQLSEWKKSRPLSGLKVLHHVPLVPITLLKISCIAEAGAEIIVTNPSFMQAHADAIAVLKKENIAYAANLTQLKKHTFDIYFDCSAVAYQRLRFSTLTLNFMRIIWQH